MLIINYQAQWYCDDVGMKNEVLNVIFCNKLCQVNKKIVSAWMNDAFDPIKNPIIVILGNLIEVYNWWWI